MKMNQRLDPNQIGDQAEKLGEDLHSRIVGQEEAIKGIVSVFQTHLAGMISPGRPIASMLFLGPTGSGKTRLVEAVAESLVGDARAVIKVDCAEFQHSHETAKLIGSPPGYLGHRETHPLLSQEVLNQHHTEKMQISFVLFDEIEKASDALWNLLLGILDKATLTLGDNRRVDFSRALIFMTSNLGAREMNSILRPAVGFVAGQSECSQANGTIDESLNEKVKRAGLEAARRKFSPEFVNRINKIVVFRGLGITELRKILQIELNVVQQRIFNVLTNSPFIFELTDDAKNFLLAEGTDMKYGARHLKRAVDRYLVHPLSNLIATGQVRGGDLIRVDLDSALKTITFFKDKEDMPAYVMARKVVDGNMPTNSTLAATAGGSSISDNEPSFIGKFRK